MRHSDRITELKRRRGIRGIIGCPSDTKNPDDWDWDNWDNWPDEDKEMFPIKESKMNKFNRIKESEASFVDKWHDTCEILPDCDNVWFIADGKMYVGLYEPEQKMFCMADGMGVQLKDVRQWKYVTDKQMMVYPNEKDIVAIEVPELPCLAVGIFTDHCEDEYTGDEFSAVVLDEEYQFSDVFANTVPWNEVFSWYRLPEEPIVILDPHEGCCDDVLSVQPCEPDAEIGVDGVIGVIEPTHVPMAVVEDNPSEEISVDGDEEVGDEDIVSDVVDEQVGDELSITPDTETALPSPEEVTETSDEVEGDESLVKSEIVKNKNDMKESRMKKMKESKIRFVAINGKRDGYSPDQCDQSMTVEELISELENFDSDSLVYLVNDRGYTYGSITSDDIYDDVYDDDDDDDDEEIEESKKSTGKKLQEDNYGWEIREDSVWEAFDYCKEVMGAEELAEALAKAMGEYQLKNTLEYICRNYEISGPFLVGYVEDDDDDEEIEESKKSVKSNKKLKESKEVSMNDGVRDWYMDKYPTDDMGQDIDEEISFNDIHEGMNKGEDFYDMIGVGDSLIRERIFTKMSELLDCDYEDIYYLWLDGPSGDKSHEVDVPKGAKIEIEKYPLEQMPESVRGLMTEYLESLNG